MNVENEREETYMINKTYRIPTEEVKMALSKMSRPNGKACRPSEVSASSSDTVSTQT